jgi:accessory gene regulator protein AgrB
MFNWTFYGQINISQYKITNLFLCGQIGNQVHNLPNSLTNLVLGPYFNGIFNLLPINLKQIKNYNKNYNLDVIKNTL